MAHTTTIRKNAFQQAILFLVAYAAGTLVLYLLHALENIYGIALMGIGLTIIIYLILYFGFLKFVKETLDPIYKILGKAIHDRKELAQKLKANKLSEDLDDEIKIWADHQTNEVRQLREMEQYRKDFLGNVSHELKTPIFNIQGYILTLLDGGIDDPNINKLYLQRAEKSINRMVSIVDDLVSISRLESGEFKLDMEVFNIVKLVEDVFESHEMISKKYKVKLEFDKNYTKSIKVKADKRRITEVLNNLLMNSIKYGKVGGKTKVGFSETGESVMVVVSDNGIGIAEEDLPRVFERFYRVDKSRSRDSGGTGLGLSIVKHIILAHNQSINVRSVENKGTTFIFSLEKA